MNNAELATRFGHVSSSVGHQVINLLSTIVSQTEILRAMIAGSDRLSPELSDRLDAIVRVSLDASGLTRKLLGLSHEVTSIEGPDGSKSEAVDLGELATRFTSAMKASSNPAVDWKLDQTPAPRINGNAHLIESALKLLVENSVESFPGGRGTVTVCVVPGPRDWVTIEVRDNGCGMTNEVLERAAEPFFTTKPDRLGLGLTIARSIWRRHRGSMALDSTPGKGTVIRLSVPPIGTS